MGLDGLRVLVVEDEFLVAMEIELLLEDFGCAVVGPVASVDEALEAIREQKLDGAIVDLNLHGEYAYPVAEALRAREVPFVFVSGYTGLPDPPATLRKAPRLRKPFAAAELSQAMARACGRAA